MKVYHGTTIDNAKNIVENGWRPFSGGVGANCGNNAYLYVTTEKENALWFAAQKGGDTIIEIEVGIDELYIDPEDGVGETVEEELFFNNKNGFPSNFTLRKEVFKNRFEISDVFKNNMNI